MVNKQVVLANRPKGWVEEQAEYAVASARDFEALTRACPDSQGF